MVKQDCSQQLPKLPKGDGTLIYTHGGKILYRKSIPVDGDYKLRRERHGIAQEPFCTFLDKLYIADKKPPQSLKTALWRFDFMNTNDIF